MIGAASLAFPGSRTLAGWWRQLAPQGPQGWWIGYVFVHRVEALALVHKQRKVDEFTALVLRALDLVCHAPRGNGRWNDDFLDQLNTRLHLGRAALLQSLRALAEEGLVQQEGTAGWTLTPLGRQGLMQGEVPAAVLERRVFPFLERLADSGARVQEPHFFQLAEGSGVAWTADDSHRLDVNLIYACVAQAETWKRRFGFPLEVQALFPPEGPEVGPSRLGPAPETWRRVVVDRPERQLVVVVHPRAAPGEVRVFGARQEGWVLYADTPLGIAAEGGPDLFPALERPVDPWPAAWLNWGQQRGFSADELNACRLDLAGECLRLHPPGSLADRLHAARHEILKGDTWLLAGEGWLRPAVRIEVHIPMTR